MSPPVYRPEPNKIVQPKAISQPRNVPTAPPVYRPQQKGIAQPKMASGAQAHTPPKAPPVYRPQPERVGVQAKMASSSLLKKPPVAPPVYHSPQGALHGKQPQSAPTRSGHPAHASYRPAQRNLSAVKGPNAVQRQSSGASGGVIQLTKLWINNGLVELLYDAHVGSGHLKVYVPLLSDYVYVRETDLGSFPYRTGMPPQPPVDEVPLYHATALTNLDSISARGLEANRGGRGGFTDNAATMNNNQQVQQERQRVSANKVHLASATTANTYYSGFKLSSAHGKLRDKKIEEAMGVLREQHPEIKQTFKLRELAKQRVDADPEVQASYAKLHEQRAMLVMHERIANARYYDADPHEGQIPQQDVMAVRTERDVLPSQLGIVTARGEIPLLDDRAKRTSKYYDATAPRLVQAPPLDQVAATRLNQFHVNVDKTAWHEEQLKKEEGNSSANDGSSSSKM
ncbi:MAG TPA: hypothetical protein VF735_17935 [Pyrinomonadaceae bacterium]|jgi:hypothetical protein